VLPISLQGATTINARIKLAAANAWVIFWTDASNSGILPIKIKASASNVDSITSANTLSQVTNNLGQAKELGNYVVSVRKGYQKFYGLAKSSSCAWTIDTNVVANTFMYVKMATCDNKVVSFYTVDSLVSTNSPISITLGQNQVIGQLTTQTIGLPTGCGGSNMVNVNLSPGNYTYFAKRSNGDCAWSGSFTVGTSACQLVRLENCKP
ncbi:MAG: hypothetical protein K2Q22_12005, partial [Cytophagales bacterium]|nr:hypothetical protein [Cytophagales bacterium]